MYLRMNYQTASVLSIEELTASLNGRETGLSQLEVDNRLKRLGKNVLKRSQNTAFDIFVRQFRSPFFYLLAGASVVSLFMGEMVNSLMIVLFITINIILGFWQENRSEKTVQLLQKYLSHHTHVLRDNKVVLVNTQDIVPGDVVVLKAGDKLPADIRFISLKGLAIDESILTGESIPVEKIAEKLSREPSKYFQAKNIGFSGTTIASGEASGVVIATGGKTETGHLANLTAKTKVESPFYKNIAAVSQVILKLTLVSLVAVFFLHLLVKGNKLNIGEFAVFSVALAVGVVPEALPLVITLSLSQGALRLAKKKVVPRRLSAIEELGSIKVLCVDKTGTITENILNVDETFDGAGNEIIRYATLASSFLEEKDKQPNNAFDLALWQCLRRDERKSIRQTERLFETPFNPAKRRNSLVVVEKGQKVLITRGAPESIVADCTTFIKNGKEKPFIGKVKKEYLEWVKQKGREGKRTLAVAIKKDYRQEEKNLIFLGLISFVDPLKKTTQRAMNVAKKLGVVVKILTGDNKEVAGYVAYTIGLVDNPESVLTGEEFEKLSKKEKKRAVEDYHIFARIMPEQKYEIIKLLKKKYLVGFVGEGFNDAPALKLADVALAIQGASDIAQDASDILLLNKSLSVITDGIREGRRTFTNSVKYVKATLASNFGNFYALAVASLTIPFLPMLPLQILLVNFLSDFPLISIVTDTVDVNELKKPQEFNLGEVLFVATLLGLVSTAFDFAFFGYFVNFGEAPLQTMWFIGSVITELVFLFSVRTRKLFYQAKRPSISVLTLTFLAAFLALILPFTSFGRIFFSFIAPPVSFMIVTFFLIVFYFLATELVKISYYRLRTHQEL